MRVICIDNKGAESYLVVGKVYYVKNESIDGKYFYLRGVFYCWNSNKFKPLMDERLSVLAKLIKSFAQTTHPNPESLPGWDELHEMIEEETKGK
jgi:hypothetical protein